MGIIGYKGQNARPRAGVLAASLYAQGSAAGVPQCAACGQIFTRVEGLKKHLNSGCIAKPQTPSADTGTATAEEAQVPSQRAESPRGRTLQAVPESLPLQPRFEDPVFQSAVLKDWRLAALDPLHSKYLSERCIFCGQWGSRLKQHLRLMHASSWRMKAVAESMCQSAGLSATSPCSYCSIRVQQPRRHVLSCIVPFQVALAKLAITEGQHGRRPDGGEPVGSGPAGAGDGLQRTPSRGQEREGEGNRGCSGEGRWETSQVATGREQGQRSILQFLGKLESRKTPLGRAAAVQGELQGGGSSDTRAASLLGEDVGSARTGTHEDPSRRGIHSLLRYFRPRLHGHASGGGSVVVGSVFPGQGEHGSEDDAHYVDDERHEGTSGECPSRGGPTATLLHGRMAEGGSYGIGSCVGLSHLECQGEETRSGIHPSTEALGRLEAPGRPSRAPAAGWSGHEVQYHQAPGPHERVQDGGRSDDAAAQPERGLGSAMLRCYEGPQRECGDVHNDEELPEPDLEPGEIWEDSEYGSDQEQDLFGDEDSGPPNLPDEEIKDLDRKAMVTEIDRLIAMQAVQRTALSEIEKEEKTEGEREEKESSGTKWLTTKFVFDWRFRERKWIRRARLVAREFKSQEHRTDTFSPATSASLVRLIPILGLQQEHSLYSIDVKDAFLQVPQRNRTACEFPKEYVELFGDEDPQCRNDGFLLLRVLPGQRDAALLWSDHFASTLQEQQFSRCVACPTLFRDTRNSILVVHVDDIQAAGKIQHLEPVLSKIGETYELKVEGPFLTDQERMVGESHQNIRFLKRKFTFHNHELHITCDPKYLTKLKEELKLKTKASKPTPCTQDSQQVDNTNNLDQEQPASFRKCVGILLYVGQDRPDLQFAVRGLASKMSGPTHHSWKQLVHLVQYMSKTEGYHLVYRKTPRGISNLHQSIRNGSFDFSMVAEKQEHLLEVFSDSDWAGNKSSRKSTSSGTMFLDGQVIYTFSRNQKSVALSSGEAEYYAGASAASDSILLKEAIQFLTGKRCKVNLYLDSSAARGIITRQGVGRVKHLQIRTLFLQELHKQGTLSVHPVGTKENTADIGTKPLSGKRIKLLLHWLGFQDENNEPVGREELQEHRSQEQARASVRMIKSKGNFAFAALLFSAISGISEGLFAGKVSGTVLQPGLCQDVMCSDTSMCIRTRNSV